MITRRDALSSGTSGAHTRRSWVVPQTRISGSPVPNSATSRLTPPRMGTVRGFIAGAAVSDVVMVCLQSVWLAGSCWLVEQPQLREELGLVVDHAVLTDLAVGELPEFGEREVERPTGGRDCVAVRQAEILGVRTGD